MNQLYYGDNLTILRDHIPAETVDLVYLDPPSNSNRSYNVLTGRDFPRLQILTIADLLNAAEPKLPANLATFKTAERIKEGGTQTSLFD